jgi:serine/threonine protein kinase
MSDAGALRDIYDNLEVIDQRRDGVRFTATFGDGTPVVVLAIAPDVTARVRSTEQFEAAFQHAAALHHEALVPPIAWGAASDGTLHCAYARLETTPLAPGSLAPATVADIGVQIARALSAAHNAGFVHGAIATPRIVLARDRGSLLNEFGLFAALNEGGLGPQETIGLLCEPGYASPEVQEGKDPDGGSDIYGLGASLYELLTGKPPYGGRTTSFVLASVLSEEYETAGPGAASNPVIDAVMRAIERAPEDRWPNAAAFATALAAGVRSEQGRVTADKNRGGVGGFLRKFFRGRAR